MSGPTRRYGFGVAALATALAGLSGIMGCRTAPMHAIPQERSPRIRIAEPTGPFEPALLRLGYGAAELADGAREEVITLPVGEDADAFLYRRSRSDVALIAALVANGGGSTSRFLMSPDPTLPDPTLPDPTLAVDDLMEDASFEVFVLPHRRESASWKRPATRLELERAHALLHPSFAPAADARAWLAERTAIGRLRQELASRLGARAAVEPEGSPSLFETLATLYSVRRRVTAPALERALRKDSRLIAGFAGWERGNYSGYSWSFPTHLEMHDESRSERDFVLFPLLSGRFRNEDGETTVIGPALSFFSRSETLRSRSNGGLVLGTGSLSWEDESGLTEVTAWPAGTLVTHATEAQTLGISVPTLSFYLRRRDEEEDAESRWLVLPPLLTATYRYETRGTTDELPHERGFSVWLGPIALTDYDRVGARHRRRLLLAPLLGYHESASGENLPDGTDVLATQEESETHLLGSLIAWSRSSPGRYRADLPGAPIRTVGRDRTSWRFLPLCSYERDGDDETRELMLWPLLGLGFGSEQGESYLRLLYFLRIPLG